MEIVLIFVMEVQLELVNIMLILREASNRREALYLLGNILTSAPHWYGVGERPVLNKYK